MTSEFKTKNNLNVRSLELTTFVDEIKCNPRYRYCGQALRALDEFSENSEEGFHLVKKADGSYDLIKNNEDDLFLNKTNVSCLKGTYGNFKYGSFDAAVAMVYDSAINLPVCCLVDYQNDLLDNEKPINKLQDIVDNFEFMITAGRTLGVLTPKGEKYFRNQFEEEYENLEDIKSDIKNGKNPIEDELEM